MNFISSLWHTKYNTINNGQLETVKLNPYQRFCRFSYGTFPETHLKNVGAAAQQALFQTSQMWADYNVEAVRYLIQKAHAKRELKPSELGITTLTSGETITCKSQLGSGGCSFSIKLSNPNESSEREACIALIYQEATNKVIIQSLSEKGKFKFEPKDDQFTKAVYSFLLQILNDSQKVTELNMGGNILIEKSNIPEFYGFKAVKQDDSKLTYTVPVQIIKSLIPSKLNHADAAEHLQVRVLNERVNIDFLLPR